MYDPFLPPDDMSTAEALELITNYQFLEPIYHSDGFGHLQVEAPIETNPYSISSLICQIELKQQWPAFIKLLPSQSELWLLNFSVELQKENSKGVLNCLVKLTGFIKTSANQITHLQYAAQWPWQSGSILLFDEIINTLSKIEQSLIKKDGLAAEINLSIVRQTLIALKPIKVTLN
ncbi:hypothetical protein [Candidatus Colwellia aromaticivorans]|uniref:hypothetical protein n=1 Tax=Candidatus Colwellia aromaticivorans TaxID=2267621 RepID=UPI000DF3A7A9|nr:hypothetical protein [Candidatus Colwellia aromaticivorans]